MAQATVHNTTPAPIDSTRRRFLTVSAGASIASVGTLALAAMPADHACGLSAAADPVFGIIAAHAKSVGQVKTAIQHGLANNDDFEDDFNDLCGTEMDLFQELLKVVPTTLAGVVALVAHLNQVCEQDPWKFGDNYATPMIGTLAQAFQRMGV